MIALLALLGCDGGAEEASCSVGEASHYVISELTFARRVDGVVQGFDLDGTDAATCGHEDLVSPQGATGIDNNFSALVPLLESTEAVAAESLVKQSIAAGELMITISVDGLEDWDTDDCVDFTLGRAGGVPLVAPDGVVLADQTLAPHPTIASVAVQGHTDADRLYAEGLSFNLPLDILNAELDFIVTDGAFWVQRRYDGAITGVMAGQIPIRQITEILERDDVNLQEFVPLVQNVADIEGEDGTCDGLSLAFEFTALPVYLEGSEEE